MATTTTTSSTKAFGTAVTVATYALAAGAAWAAAPLAPALGWDHPVAVALAADLGATVAVFLMSVLFRNASLYDPYWSVIPPAIAAYFVWVGEGVLVRQVLLLIPLTLWAVRLTWNWYRGWSGLDHEDWRYRMLAEQSGVFYPAVNLLGIHLFPTLLVFAGMVATWPALGGSTAPLGLLDGVAFAVGLGAVLLQGVADEQLRAFRARNTDPAAWIDEGLWAWMRRPNYAGEIGIWLSMGLFGLAAAPEAWWFWAPGTLCMIGLFAGISVPMMDRKMLTKRPGYAAFTRQVPGLWPWPPSWRRKG